MVYGVLSAVIVKFLLVTVSLRLNFVNAQVSDVLENSNYARCTESLVIVTTNKSENVTQKRFSERVQQQDQDRT